MIWNLVYWVLLVLAILVGLRGLFWDRAGFRGRARLRCRKCWYDLTASPGDLKDGAIVCSECGKEHASRRAMRKTRRSKKWIAVALVLWMGAYGASVTPRVQKSGWGAAVPRVVIVASLPFLSEESGTGLGAFGPWGPKGVPISAYEQMVLDEVVAPGYQGWGFVSGGQEYGWFSRRLAFLLAKLESESTLTNGTQAKGRAFKSVLSQIVQTGGALKSERNWANQVVYVEMDTDMAFGPKEDVFGTMKIRRMMQGGYQLQFGDMVSVYQCSTPNSMRMNGMQPMNPTVEYWVERFLWDSVHELDRARGRTYTARGYRYRPGKDMGNGVGRSRVRFWISEHQRSQSGYPSKDSKWLRVATIDRDFEYEIDPSRITVGDSSAQLRAQIERNIKARLTVEYDGTRQQWVPVVKLELRGRPLPPDEQGVLFGGGVSINIVWADSYDPLGLDYLKGHWDNWWLWDVQQVEGQTIEVPGDSETPTRNITIPSSRRVQLSSANTTNTRLPGELDPSYYRVSRNDGKKPARVILAMKTPQGTGWQRFGGLWGEVVYGGDLVFEIEHWTPIELKRYIVNGIVPDHAMP